MDDLSTVEQVFFEMLKDWLKKEGVVGEVTYHKGSKFLQFYFEHIYVFPSGETINNKFQIGKIKLWGRKLRMQLNHNHTWLEDITVNDAYIHIPHWVAYCKTGIESYDKMFKNFMNLK